MAWVPYDNHKTRQYNGNAINFSSDTIKLMLVSSSYTPSQTSHVFKSDLTGEVSGTGYTARGTAVVNKTLTMASNTLTFDFDDITFSQSASGFSNARYAILYKDTGVDATSPLIAYYDFGGNKGNTDGDLLLQTPSGVFSV